MKVDSVCNNSNRLPSPNFKSYHRSVMEPRRGLVYRNDTGFFRDVVLWENLIYLLKEKFENVPKVNVYSYGCSDGSEALSFIMKILAAGDKHLERKFLPVIAKDIDQFIIDKANSREYFYLNNEEIFKINSFTNGRYKDFFSEIDKTYMGSFAFAKSNLYEKVKFSIADIRKDYKNIKSENSVVFARNFWPYIKNKPSFINNIADCLLNNFSSKEGTDIARKALLKNLALQLKKNSLLIVGDYDLREAGSSFEEEILDAGFKSTNISCVFEKL